MISQDEARARVQRGAAHLDVVRPGWFNQIDTGTLTLSDCGHCVLGQLEGDFHRGVYMLVPTHHSGESNPATTHGFGLSKFDVSDDGTWTIALMRPLYQMLQDAWIEAIADRRLSTTVEVQTASDAVGLSVMQPVAANAR